MRDETQTPDSDQDNITQTPDSDRNKYPQQSLKTHSNYNLLKSLNI